MKTKIFKSKFFPFGKIRMGFLSIIIAGAVFAPQMLRAINNSNASTKTITNNRNLYLVHIQDPTNSGVYHSYLYSPKICFSFSAIIDSQDIIPAQYVGLLPTVASSDTIAYLKADFDIGERDASSLNWANISVVVADIAIFSGATYSVASADTTNYVWTTVVQDVTYVYVDGVLTPITIVTNYIDNVEFVEITASAASTPTGVVVPNDNTLSVWVSNGTLIIENGELKIENVVICDVMGKLILNSQLSILNSINVSSLPQGVYFLKIQTDKGMVTKKFIKQ